MAKTKPSSSQRIMALDYLRGLFIVILIVDHLWRWPNLLQFTTGRGELWVSAAEGFILISGMLVGYIHGYKKRNNPLKPISVNLIKRGLMLYAWMWITTIILVFVTWNLSLKGNMAYIPVPVGDWSALFTMMLKLDYAHTLTHFLYLYAIYLIVSPIALWLLRQGKWWLLLTVSFIVYVIGLKTSTEYMQWQILFFSATAFGFYFDNILAKFRSLSKKHRYLIRLSAIALFGFCFLYSMSLILTQTPGVYIDPIFTRRPLSIATLPMAFLWFIGLLSLFVYLTPFLDKTARWLLAFGQRSLTAYILHIVPLVIVQFVFEPSDGNFWLNTLLAVFCISATWALLQIPGINRLVPR